MSRKRAEPDAGHAAATGAAHDATIDIGVPADQQVTVRVAPGSRVHVIQPKGYAASRGTRARSRGSAELAVKAKALRAADMTVEQIAEEIDRSPRQVSRYLARPD